MAEEAVETAAIEIGKEIISRGAEIIVKLTGTTARTVCEALKNGGAKATGKAMAKIDEKINSGEMSVKRLYKLGSGNLQQTKISGQVIEQVKENLKKQGVAFALEENGQDEIFLHFQGKDFDHVSHVVDQVLEEMGINAEDQIGHEPEREGAAPAMQENVTGTRHDASPNVPPAYPPKHEESRTSEQSATAEVPKQLNANNPLSEDYVPTPEEAEYFEAAGFEAGEPSADLTHYGKENMEIDVQAFHEHRPNEQEDERENVQDTAVERDQEPVRDTDRNTPQIPLAERLASQNAGMDEPERTESSSVASIRYDSSDGSSMGADTSNGQNDYDADLDGQQQDTAMDTSAETRSKTVKGRKTKKASIKQRLRTEISNRARQKQIAAKNQAALNHGQPKRAGRSK